MLTKQKQGYLLLFLTFITVFICMGQRAFTVSGINTAISSGNSFTSSSIITDPFVTQIIVGSDDKTTIDKIGIGSCELSSKSLYSVPPFSVEPLFFAVLFIALMTNSTPHFYRSRKRKHRTPQPRIRRHLQFCVLLD